MGVTPGLYTAHVCDNQVLSPKLPSEASKWRICHTTPLSLRTSLKYLSYGWVLPEASELIVWRGGALGIGPPPTGFISIIFLSSVQPEKGLGLCLLEDLPQIDWKYPPASLEVFDC